VVAAAGYRFMRLVGLHAFSKTLFLAKLSNDRLNGCGDLGVSLQRTADNSSRRKRNVGLLFCDLKHIIPQTLAEDHCYSQEKADQKIKANIPWHPGLR
jgi:hypothetical protein